MDRLQYIGKGTSRFTITPGSITMNSANTVVKINKAGKKPFYNTGMLREYEKVANPPGRECKPEADLKRTGEKKGTGLQYWLSDLRE